MDLSKVPAPTREMLYPYFVDSVIKSDETLQRSARVITFRPEGTPTAVKVNVRHFIPYRPPVIYVETGCKDIGLWVPEKGIYEPLTVGEEIAYMESDGSHILRLVNQIAYDCSLGLSWDKNLNDFGLEDVYAALEQPFSLNTPNQREIEQDLISICKTGLLNKKSRMYREVMGKIEVE